MNTVTFTVFGEPKGKARPKFANIGGFIKSYQTKEQNAAENYVKMAYLEAAKGVYLSGPLEMKVTAYFQVPKSVSIKKGAAMVGGIIRPLIKPDADNCIKNIADALNKVAYDDDKAIVSISFDKFYSARAYTIIELRELN